MRLQRLMRSPLDAGHQRIKQSRPCYDVCNNAIASDARTERMKWSKLKQQIEAQFADSVRTHAAIHITRYGQGVSRTMTRGWLTWDGAEIFSFSTIAWLQAEHTEATNPLASDKSISIAE